MNYSSTVSLLSVVGFFLPHSEFCIEKKTVLPTPEVSKYSKMTLNDLRIAWWDKFKVKKK